VAEATVKTKEMLPLILPKKKKDAVSYRMREKIIVILRESSQKEKGGGFSSTSRFGGRRMAASNPIGGGGGEGRRLQVTKKNSGRGERQDALFHRRSWKGGKTFILGRIRKKEVRNRLANWAQKKKRL